MGIRNLQTYMQNNPAIYYQINIQDTLQSIPVEKRVVVLDGTCCINKLYEHDDYLRMLSNGQYQECRRTVRSFIEFFERHNVKLVVFFDGTIVPQKRATWIQRRMEGYDRVLRVFDALNNGGEVNKNDVLLPPATQTVAISEFYKSCDIVFSTDRECDDEILEYANQHDCLAILSNDTDFAVSAGNWSYWSIKDIDIEKGTTYVYDKQALANNFQLDESQLPLLATLMGNDVIDMYELKRFHHRLSGHKDHRPRIDRALLFKLVASYVSRFNLRLTMEDLHTIAMDAFGTTQASGRIRESCNTYMGTVRVIPKLRTKTSPAWTAVLRRALELKKTHRMGLALSSVLAYNQFNMVTAFEDLRLDDMPSAGLHWRPLRAKIYGICLTAHPQYTQGLRVEEWIFSGPGSLERPFYVRPEPSPIMPEFDLVEHWSEDLTTEQTDRCWKLFCSTLHPQLSSDEVRVLPEYMLPAVLTVLWMWRACHMQRAEYACFLMVAALCHEHDVAVDLIAANNAALDRINTRALRLSTMFLRGVKTVAMLACVCGRLMTKDDFNYANIFDGLLFQYHYAGHTIEGYESPPDYLQCLDFVERHKELF